MFHTMSYRLVNTFFGGPPECPGAPKKKTRAGLAENNDQENDANGAGVIHLAPRKIDFDVADKPECPETPSR